MRNFSLSHLDSRDLKSSAASYLSHTDVNEAYVLAHVAEMDARKMFREEAYSSMREYCIQELQMSDDVASKRLRAARTARRFPVLFEAIADSRTSLPSTLFQQQAPGPVGGSDQQAPGPVETQLPRPRVTPLAPQRFACSSP